MDIHKEFSKKFFIKLIQENKNKVTYIVIFYLLLSSVKLLIASFVWSSAA
jgi:hypothetical protein